MRLSDTLPAAFVSRGSTLALNLSHAEGRQSQEQLLDHARALDRFLAGIEHRAFRIARMALGHDEDALDIVQDAMLQLARRYGARPEEEWRPLFYRILQNRVRDHQRRQRVRAKVMSWLPAFKAEEESTDPMESVPDQAPMPADQLAQEGAIQKLEIALRALPTRQQEAFALRNFEGLDVAQTAQAMRCSEGSVKTHYSRAVHALREQLGDHW
jgi:RNA polymerase sigma-70 factor (ECF subfamily)